MKELRKWLKGFFTLGAVDPNAQQQGGEGGGGEGGDAGDASGDAGDQNLDANLDLDQGGDAGDAGDAGDQGDQGDQGQQQQRPGRAQETIQQLRARAQAAEQERDRFREEADTLRRGPPSVPMDEERKRFEDEERVLRDPNADANAKWRIEANRRLRENTRNSQQALFEAKDMADRTEFSVLATTKPTIHKRYGERVEAELARIRKAGGNAPRMGILQFLIGQDALNGKLQPRKQNQQQQQAQQQGANQRQQLPGARSDVSSKQRQTEREKRRARLENQQI